jgi:hypothetical protein
MFGGDGGLPVRDPPTTDLAIDVVAACERAAGVDRLPATDAGRQLAAIAQPLLPMAPA